MNPIAVLPVLGGAFAVSAVLFAALWLVSLRLRDPSFVDAWWALGVAPLVWVTWAFLDRPDMHAHLIALLASAWSLRLGLYLLARWRAHGPDRRYQKLAQRAQEKHGMSFAAFAALWVFGPQLLLQFVMALPAMLGQMSWDRPLGPLAYVGAAVAMFGILYQAIADEQLTAFKRDPANAGKVMDRGLWRYSRHPNYFGELCTWWGIFAVALETPLGLWSLPGPLLITFLLTRVSGAPTTEPHLQRTRPDYAAYKARTSAFIPMPPKAS